MVKPVTYCPRCHMIAPELRRVIGTYEKPGEQFLQVLPVGDLICPTCFEEQGLPPTVRLAREED
jgi:hypothetical protein